MADNRREARQRVFLKGRIMFNNGASSLDCLVRDLSPAGARLAMSQTTTLPEAFDLFIPQKDRTYRAMLRWRREDGVGVALPEEATRPVAPPERTGLDEAGAPVAMLLRRIAELEAENAALRRLLAGVAPSDASTAAA